MKEVNHKPITATTPTRGLQEAGDPLRRQRPAFRGGLRRQAHAARDGPGAKGA